MFKLVSHMVYTTSSLHPNPEPTSYSWFRHVSTREISEVCCLAGSGKLGVSSCSVWYRLAREQVQAELSGCSWASNSSYIVSCWATCGSHPAPLRYHPHHTRCCCGGATVRSVHAVWVSLPAWRRRPEARRALAVRLPFAFPLLMVSALPLFACSS